MRNFVHMSVDDIFEDIIKNHKNGEDSYTYIILGKTGATGKTTLCEELNRNGYKAFEISESIFNQVQYTDDNNHYVINRLRKQVVIVLNKAVR